MRPTRFERKILVAIGVVAVGSLVGALLVGRAAVRDAYRTGVNPQLLEHIQSGIDARRAGLVALRDAAKRTADGVADHADLRVAIEAADGQAVRDHFERMMQRYGNIRSVRLEAPNLPTLRVERRDLDDERFRSITEHRTLTRLSGRPRVAVELIAPRRLFDEYQRAGDEAEVYERLVESVEYVSSVYLWVYMAFVSLIAAAAVAVGAYLSRRVTRRVAALVGATRRVGAGDMTVRVESESDDEIGDLTEAFNTMVADLDTSRRRIEYLQRIGAWQEFARRLAHEIKNPLTPIQLASQEMHRGYAGDDATYRRKLEDAAQIIEEEIATLRRLVGEFSAFARLPKADLEESTVAEFLEDVGRGVPAILEDVEGEGLGEVEVRFETPIPEASVEIDAMMLRRCLDNLLRNAAQATGALHGDGGGKVIVAARAEDGWIAIEVRDDGPGVPDEDVERVFDPYYTTKAHGTGLGLPIVKKVVLEHGGTIECGRAPEGGARFTIWLPSILPTLRS